MLASATGASAAALTSQDDSKQLVGARQSRQPATGWLQRWQRQAGKPHGAVTPAHHPIWVTISGKRHDMTAGGFEYEDGEVAERRTVDGPLLALQVADWARRHLRRAVDKQGDAAEFAAQRAAAWEQILTADS